MWSFTKNDFQLTHISQALFTWHKYAISSLLLDIGKQPRPRSDATERGV